MPSCPSVGPAHPCLLLFPQDSPEAGGEQEEEQAFLVSLYKFMKERHTPIERVPHLGFKQSASLGGGGWCSGRVSVGGQQPGDVPRQDNRQGTSAKGDPGCRQPVGVACEDGASLKARGGVGFSSSWAACPVHNSGPAWECGVTEPDRLPCLFPSVNLWKIYKAVEKLGAYELVRKDSLKSLAVLQPQPYPPAGARESAGLSLPADTRKIRMPRSCLRAVGWGTVHFASLSRFPPIPICSTLHCSKTCFAQQSGSPWEGELVGTSSFL